MQIELPKLKKVDNRKKILLLGDDIRFSSGIATISREIVFQTADKYQWVNLGAAMKHPDHGKVIDVSSEVPNSSIKIYAHTGYGNPDVLREVISVERPDAIVFITDPRFWGWLAVMEHEIRSIYKIPLIYINVWDQASPFPLWNSSLYASCDLLFSINKGTKVVNSECLRWHGTEFTDLDKEYDELKGSLLKYLPHGLNPNQFFKIREYDKEFEEFKNHFFSQNDVEFLVFFNSRNIRRKQPGDVILAFKMFCDQLPKEKAKKCCLLMKTQIQDENGTDLMAVKQAICPEYKILFHQDLIPPHVLNWFYNIADCTIFMSSAEGFGLAANESILAETLLVAPVTGGLQDQMRFETSNGEWLEFDANFPSNHRGTFTKCGPWAFPVFPRTRLLQGSIPTPYIFDDCSDASDAASRLLEIYSLNKEEREERAAQGRKWATSEESGMSAPIMAARFVSGMETLFSTWKPKRLFEIVKVEEKQPVSNIGILN